MALKKRKKGEIEKEIKKAEKWVLAKRKFFIKLGYTILLIVVLLLISHFILDA